MFHLLSPSVFGMSFFLRGQLESPNLTVTRPLIPPLEVTKTGLAFPDEGEGDAISSPAGDKAEYYRRFFDWDAAAKCLPVPPPNGMVICAMTWRYPPVKKMNKKAWSPFEEVAARMIRGVSVRTSVYDVEVYFEF